MQRPGVSSLVLSFAGIVAVLGGIWFAVTSLFGPAAVEEVALEELVRDQASYSNAEVCVPGFYRSSNQFSALGSEFVEFQGQWALSGIVIWVDGLVEPELLECDNFGACRGKVTLCGTFQNGGPYGRDNAFAYQLVLNDAKN